MLIKRGETHRRDQVGGILLFYIISILVIRVNICYNKILQL